MSRTLTASDRSALIRLASTLPKGSDERKAILAGLRKRAEDYLDTLVKTVERGPVEFVESDGKVWYGFDPKDRQVILEPERRGLRLRVVEGPDAQKEVFSSLLSGDLKRDVAMVTKALQGRRP
jgi:hypothetical protein